MDKKIQNSTSKRDFPKIKVPTIAPKMVPMVTAPVIRKFLKKNLKN